jgi:hyperosmotically inducible periplasmic protein
MDRMEEIKSMKLQNLGCRLLLGPTLLLGGALVIGGCSKSYPDEKPAVDQALTSNDFGTVGVSQDRKKGVMTLKGNVGVPGDKTRAEKIAQRAAPDYTIANEIGVRPEGMPNAAGMDSKLDSAIEDQFKAQIKSHKNLDDQSISGSAKNGTLVIKGSVKTPQQKAEAESLAKQLPNVQQVVNELTVKSNKHSTPSS